MLKRIYLFSMLSCLALSAMAGIETRSVTFDFSTAAAIQAWGLPVPTQSNPTSLQFNLVNEEISLVPSSNAPTLTFYQNRYTFYSKNGQSFSFQAAEGATITRIDFNGMYTSQRFTANPTGFDANNAYWSGSASKVTFTGTGGNTLYSMTVTYEVELPDYDPCDVNRDGAVTAADVTALYNYLLNNDMTYYNSCDVNGDGNITSSDITSVYNYLLNGGEPPTPAVPMPTFSHPSGTVFNTPTEVTVTGPANSRIYITTDGSTPSTTHYHDNAYGSITVMVGFNMTLKAIAVVDGQSSAVATAVYSLVEVPGPTFNPPSGTVFQGTGSVTITGPYGSMIYFTLDGSTPTTSHYYSHGNSPYTIEELEVGTTTIKAIAVLNGVASPVMTAVYTVEEVIDNNINANWKETAFNIPELGPKPTTSSATYNQAWRLEYPHINTGSNYMVVVHATNPLGISLSLELDKSQRANRWTCYTMHSGVPNNNVGRVTSTFHPDECVPTAYQVAHNEYTTGKYTTSCTNLDGSNMTLFARGHICASEDRQTTEDQNYDTFTTSNIHPQYQAHNAGLWQRMETKVQNWGYSNSFRDTLYVCKGATIGNVTLNGTTASGIIPYSEVRTKFGVNLTGTLVIPRYWYMAVLRLKNGQYEAMAYWTEQINSNCNSTTLQSCMITIDELERRTGIDFFCNLPDDIEEQVETTLNTSIWQ